VAQKYPKNPLLNGVGSSPSGLRLYCMWVVFAMKKSELYWKSWQVYQRSSEVLVNVKSNKHLISAASGMLIKH
jgi:hypothetical protein